MKLTLLGTGVPVPDPNRRGPSQVFEIGNESILVDCGAGALHRFVEAGFVEAGGRELRLPLRCISLTHLHSDHITGLADFLWAGWVMGWWTEPPLFAGPPGTAAMFDHLIEAFAYDIKVRSYADLLETGGPAPRVEEIEEGYATEGDGWRLTAFRVDHAPVDEAFGFRLDAEAGSAVISGDTCYCENLVRHAQGVDLLVHEAYWRPALLERITLASTAAQRMRAETIARYHTPAEDAGRAAAKAEVDHLVLTHLLLGKGTPQNLLQDIAPHYSGTVTVGEDLRSFTFGESA